ncbi:MAG TPA: alkaline phosphatase family protein [Gemmatimonadales bacterium]|nr:alkaline phosphatase family protein [Gemmatimonadales bacterium]
MTILSRPTFAMSLLGALFCSTPPPAVEPGPRPASAGSTLVVLLTVDQLRQDYLDKWHDQFTGGLRRLVDSGAYFTNAHHDHAITETAPGHASLLSGRFPRSTGITRNLAGVNDANAPLLGVVGPGASPFRFRGTTLVDWLATADRRSRVLSVSVKDRGAILPVGRSKQEVYWFVGGTFTTSRYYADSLPGWVMAFAARRLPERSAGRVWDLLLPVASYPEPDSVPIENRGLNLTLPKVLPPDSARAAQVLPGTPFMEEVLVAFALEGVERLGLGRGPQTDVLAISFSSTDYIGHAYGPDSRELHDQVVRLDRQIGVLLDSLFKLRDPDDIVIALAGDHGVTPFPELSQQRYSPPPQRVNVRPAIAAARAVLQLGGVDTLAVDLESGSLVIDRSHPGMTAELVGTAADSFVAVAKRTPGVLRAERFGMLSRHDLGKDPIARRWVQMFPPEVPVEAVVVLTPGSYWDAATIAMHGGPHDDDSHVPIIFFGSPFKPGKYDQFTRTVDIAPTLAQVLGVTPAEPLDGRVLKVAIR